MLKRDVSCVLQVGVPDVPGPESYRGPRSATGLLVPGRNTQVRGGVVGLVNRQPNMDGSVKLVW